MTRRTVSCLALFVLALILPAIAVAQAFERQTGFSPAAPEDVFLADFNKDGRPDAVTTQTLSNKVTIYTNSQFGLFGGPSFEVIAAPAGAHTVRAVAADFDGDGNVDIVTANCAPAGTATPGGSIGVLYGDGAGNFPSRFISPTVPNACPNSLGIIYLPGDTRPDLVLALDAAIQEDVVLMRNTGVRNGWEPAGSFGASDATRNFGVSAADFDKDGLADVAVVSQLATGHTCVDLWFPNTTKATRRLACPANAQAANTVDLLNDGAPDLLIPFTAGVGFTGVVALVNGGTGRFTSRELSAGMQYSEVGWKASEGDFNLDGLDDILVGVKSDTANSFAIFLATGAGFWGMTYWGSAPNGYPVATATADLNADGKSDWVGVSPTTSTIDLFRNVMSGSAPGCVASLDGVTICSPAPGSTVTSPITVSAAAKGTAAGIVAMKAYLDGVQVASSSTASLTATVSAGSGTHTLTVNAWESTGKLHQSRSTFTVSGGGGGIGICSATNVGVLICQPSAGSTVASPVAIAASAKGNANIIAMKAYLDFKEVAFSSTASLSASVPAGPGPHNLTVNAWDSVGTVYKSSVNFSVAGGSACVASTVGVIVCSPANGATVSSPVTISAAAKGNATIIAMKAYVDGVQRASSSSGTLNASVTVGAGTHVLNVNAWDSAGQLYKWQSTFTVK